MIRLPDGRTIDLDGCPVCARAECQRVRTQEEVGALASRFQASDEDIERMGAAVDDCEAHRLDWRAVAGMLATGKAKVTNASE